MNVGVASAPTPSGPSTHRQTAPSAVYRDIPTGAWGHGEHGKQPRDILETKIAWTWNVVEVRNDFREPMGQGAGVLGGESCGRQRQSQRKQPFSSCQLQSKQGITLSWHMVAVTLQGGEDRNRLESDRDLACLWLLLAMV